MRLRSPQCKHFLQDRPSAPAAEFLDKAGALA